MNYKVLVTDEAINDVFDLVKYIHVELCNPGAAGRQAVCKFESGNRSKQTVEITLSSSKDFGGVISTIFNFDNYIRVGKIMVQ